MQTCLHSIGHTLCGWGIHNYCNVSFGLQSLYSRLYPDGTYCFLLICCCVANSDKHDPLTSVRTPLGSMFVNHCLVHSRLKLYLTFGVASCRFTPLACFSV
jgi:hypothetical protein